ncbi:MAG: hypothetical protein M1290_07610 [Candidatus Thermoplasmatota archaeon]|nr:hypothetical protein [Candidatus Thermoplasmatota archaeon]MCL5790308.1 hypothetical protein [Candidatus Thermoplasmatota archaeon]
MRLRFILIGIIELALSGVLYVLRGFHPAYLALMGIGIVLVVLGLFRK